MGLLDAGRLPVLTRVQKNLFLLGVVQGALLHSGHASWCWGGSLAALRTGIQPCSESWHLCAFRQFPDPKSRFPLICKEKKEATETLKEMERTWPRAWHVVSFE